MRWTRARLPCVCGAGCGSAAHQARRGSLLRHGYPLHAGGIDGKAWTRMWHRRQGCGRRSAQIRANRPQKIPAAMRHAGALYAMTPRKRVHIDESASKCSRIFEKKHRRCFHAYDQPVDPQRKKSDRCKADRALSCRSARRSAACACLSRPPRRRSRTLRCVRLPVSA